MAKFQFRLDTLRKIRQAHRDAMRARLAEAFQAAQVLEDQRQTAVEELRQAQEHQRQASAEQKTNISTIVEAQRYQGVLRSQLLALQEQSKQLEEEIEKRRRVVVEADKEVRVLDKLEERQLEEFRQDAARAEAKVLDEIGINRWEGNT